MGVRFSELPLLLDQDITSNDCVAVLNAHSGLLTKANIDHASSNGAFGVGTSDEYGHLKISDEYKFHEGGVTSGIAASQNAVFSAYTDALNLCLTAWVGTRAQWNALSNTQKNKYKIVNITDE